MFRVYDILHTLEFSSRVVTPIYDTDGHIILTMNDFKDALGRMYNRGMFYNADDMDDSHDKSQTATELANSTNKWLTEQTEQIRRINRALTEEYDPLENYDRYEVTTNTYGDVKLSKAGKESTKNELSSDYERKTVTHSDAIANTSTEKVTAYDSDTMRDNSSVINTAPARDDTATSTGKGTETNTLEFTNREDKTTRGNDTYTSHVHGNIGVVDAVQMIRGNLSLREVNLVKWVVRLYASEFII